MNIVKKVFLLVYICGVHVVSNGTIFDKSSFILSINDDTIIDCNMYTKSEEN